MLSGLATFLELEDNFQNLNKNDCLDEANILLSLKRRSIVKKPSQSTAEGRKTSKKRPRKIRHDNGLANKGRKKKKEVKEVKPRIIASYERTKGKWDGSNGRWTADDGHQKGRWTDESRRLCLETFIKYHGNPLQYKKILEVLGGQRKLSKFFITQYFIILQKHASKCFIKIYIIYVYQMSLTKTISIFLFNFFVFHRTNP